MVNIESRARTGSTGYVYMIVVTRTMTGPAQNRTASSYPNSLKDLKVGSQIRSTIQSVIL